MAGKKQLVRGAVRILGNHHGKEGKIFRVAFDALVERYGEFGTQLLRLEASRVAALWVHLAIATRELSVARGRRTKERGRRPGARDVERLSRRAGLADSSYQLGLNRLEEMVGTAKKPDLALRVLRAQERKT
jgi:hypothetical protein